jgi:hypothetical protein
MTLRTRVLIALLGLTGVGTTTRADERLAGIACRSVHLRYPAPAGDAFANEVTVDRSSDGTYFCVCGFNQGYFGLQELAGGKKVLIFSVWDPGEQDDPNAVAETRRVKLVAKDEQVRVGRFGNEGTGGQSFLDYDWKAGEPYRFLVTARTEGERTAFAAYFAPPEAKAWRHLATFSTITGGKPLGGYYSFVEDFRRDRVSATRERRARFGNGWVRGTDGHWVALTRARFTADGNPALNIDAGPRGDSFFLATGGAVKNEGTPLGQSMDRLPGGLLPLPRVASP